MVSAYALRAKCRSFRIINKIVLTLKTVSNFWSAGFDFLKLSRNQNLILGMRCGMKVKVRSNTVDSHEAVTVLSGQEYPFKVIASLINPKGIVVDVGAHIGSFTLYLKSRLPQVKIYCLEPAQSNYNILVDNLILNNLSGVKTLKMALSGKSGSVFLETRSLDSNAYFLGTDGESVASIDLDSLLEREKLEQVDLIKIDCEGAEYEALANFKQFHRVKSIILEYHERDKNLNDNYIINLLSANGFLLKYRQDLFDHRQGILYFVQANL